MSIDVCRECGVIWDAWSQDPDYLPHLTQYVEVEGHPCCRTCGVPYAPSDPGYLDGKPYSRAEAFEEWVASHREAVEARWAADDARRGIKSDSSVGVAGS